MGACISKSKKKNSDKELKDKSKTNAYLTKGFQSKQTYDSPQNIIDNLKDEETFEIIFHSEIDEAIHLLNRLDPLDIDLVIHELSEEVKMASFNKNSRHSLLGLMNQFPQLKSEYQKRTYILFLTESYHANCTQVQNFDNIDVSFNYLVGKYGEIVNFDSEHKQLKTIIIGEFLNMVVREALIISQPKDKLRSDSIDEDEEKRKSIRNPMTIHNKNEKKSLSERNSEIIHI